MSALDWYCAIVGTGLLAIGVALWDLVLEEADLALERADVSTKDLTDV